ncbi:hypothetical protein LMG7141_02263 [Ralstonia condita]|uniref:histidine kinase n=1 Tax=Ralstonia condita TaxID=3058600 RepID=A0ABN9IT32_9RALS|nr:PAS domain-containing protein [Ralstonia sp. LMG 7141]CAJ0789684.1 hypothetical protein LMG7141_02263 [Ralstonia sp. LMG 7141]
MNPALGVHLTEPLARALLPFIVACGAGSLLLRLLDDLRSAETRRARLPLTMTALFAAIALWTLPLLPLLPRWSLPEDAAPAAMVLASFCWSVAVAALWCVLGGRPGTMRAVSLGVLLSISGPVTVLLLAGVSRLGAVAWGDAGLLGIVMVLSAAACAAALQFAFTARSGALGVAVRRPAVSLLVSVLFGIGLTLDAVYAASLGNMGPVSGKGAPVWLQWLMALGAAATVLAGYLLGYRDRAAGDTATAVAAREIRRRKETMQALNDLEQSYRQREAELAGRHQLLLDGADVGLWEFDLVTRGAQFSTRFAAMLGYSLKEIGPSTSEYLRLVHPDDLPMVLNRIQAHVDGNTSAYAAQFRMRHKDGAYREVVAHGVVWRDASGRAVRMAGSHVELPGIKDVTANTAVAEMEVAASASGAPARHGLWESWSPLDHEQPGPPSADVPAPAFGATLPSIDPNALR